MNNKIIENRLNILKCQSISVFRNIDEFIGFLKQTEDMSSLNDGPLTLKWQHNIDKHWMVMIMKVL